ncbi:hypothetical protein O205_07780 [Bacillus amyloliquefaciens EGD-AQ14]|nr:hypothetical protein BAMY6614_17675 [Bacillus amyloliquefaciens UMAF6614]ERH56156.1 hypothetical protein O205_07780 [Bacillus amyloliquefaciens EGD-AQ14]
MDSKRKIMAKKQCEMQNPALLLLFKMNGNQDDNTN